MPQDSHFKGERDDFQKRDYQELAKSKHVDKGGIHSCMKFSP